MFGRVATFVYCVLCYLIFFVTYLYAIGFIGNVFVPKSIDSGRTSPLAEALLINAGLLALFAVQHSVMARPVFKRWWTRIVPEAAERSTYVLASSLALILLFWQWRPLGGTVWSVESTGATIVLRALFAFGWGLVLVATFLIDHFDLFGMRQVWLYLTGQPYTPRPFATPWLYRYVRHPLYVGWFFAFWATPTMTSAHLLVAVATSVYILLAIQFEEHDLVSEFGDTYRDYRRRTPMLVPFTRKEADSTPAMINRPVER